MISVELNFRAFNMWLRNAEIGNVLTLLSCRCGGAASAKQAPAGSQALCDLCTCKECEEELVFDSLRKPRSLPNLANQDHIVGVNHGMSLRRPKARFPPYWKSQTCAHFYETFLQRAEKKIHKATKTPGHH